MPIPEYENDPPTERTRAIQQNLAKHTKSAKRTTIVLGLVVGVIMAAAVGFVALLAMR